MKTIYFEHDYYIADKRRKTWKVLCMCCGKLIRKKGMDPLLEGESYREIPVEWTLKDKQKAKGVILTCPDCHDIRILPHHVRKIERQIIKGMQAEAFYAGMGMHEVIETEARMTGNHITKVRGLEVGPCQGI